LALRLIVSDLLVDLLTTDRRNAVWALAVADWIRRCAWTRGLYGLQEKVSDAIFLPRHLPTNANATEGWAKDLCNRHAIESANSVAAGVATSSTR